MTDDANREQMSPADLSQRWVATMQAMADQIQRQQQAFQQMMQESMDSYVRLLNTPPFPLSGQPQDQQQNVQETFQRSSEQWMRLAQQQQETFQRMTQQWMEQTQQQQQVFQQMVQEALDAYTNMFRPST